MEFTVRAKPCRSGRPKVLAVVGKSVFRGAAERNLLKRRLRALLATEAGTRRINLVVVVRGRGEKLSFVEIKRKLAGTFK